MNTLRAFVNIFQRKKIIILWSILIWMLLREVGNSYIRAKN